MLGFLVLVFLFSGEVRAESSYWKNYFSSEERKAVVKNAEKYTLSEIESKSEKWKGIIRGYNIKNGSIDDDDIKENGIGTDKISGLGDYIDQKISGSSTSQTPQDFSADNLTGTYAALDGSRITNLSTINLNGTIDLAHGGTGATSASEARTNMGLEYASVEDVNFYNIAAWGDSLTDMNTSVLQGIMTSYSIFNKGVGGETSTQIKNRMVADTAKHNMVSIIWVGTNDDTVPDTIKANIATMVSSLTDPKRFLVIGLPGKSTQTIGTADYTRIMQLNADLAVLYPNNFIDIHTYLIDHGLADASITPTPQDIADIDNGIVPSSLRMDIVHLSNAGYTVVSQQINNFITANFSPVDNKILSYSNLENIFKNPPPVGDMNIIPGSQFNIGNVPVIQVDTTLQNYFLGGAGNILKTVTGGGNVGLGGGSLQKLTTGASNTATGFHSLLQNTIGTGNTAMGYSSLNWNTTGNYNTAMGENALFTNSTGTNNSVVGYAALYANTSGGANSAVGFFALNNNTTGNNNSAFGNQSLRNNTTGGDNVALGNNALTANTTASGNTALGTSALIANTTGSGNSAIGSSAMRANTTGNYNNSIGYNTLFSNITGIQNNAMGYAALYANTGSGNNAMGFFALQNNVTGNNNVVIGDQAGNTQADGTTALTSTNNSVYIGKNVRGFNNSDNNSVVIGYNAIGIGANSVVLGNDTITKTALKGNVGIGTTDPKTKLEVDGIIKTKERSTATCNADAKGGIYFDSDDNHFYGCNGTTWVQLDN